MKKAVIIISLFLLGTAFSVNAQEMTEKEKSNYALGMMLGERIKEEVQKSGIDMAIVETIKEKLKELIDFQSLKEGLSDVFKGELKLTQEEMGANLAELMKLKDEFEQMFKVTQNNKIEMNLQVIEEKPFDPAVYLTSLATNHGRLSWYYLFIKEYDQSEQAARRALELDATQTWVKTNLAHTLLFQGRFPEAEAIYKELSQTIDQGNETYSKVLLNDFDELEKAGVIPEEHKADVEKIRKMLRE